MNDILTPAVIYANIPGDDHHYNNLQGYLMGFYAQLPNPPTAEELEVLSHISCFAFDKQTTSHAIITELAKRISSKSKSLANRRRMVRTRLASLRQKSLIITQEVKAPDGTNYPSIIDMRPILRLTRELAEKAHWFEENPGKGGMTPQSGGDDSTVRGGMTPQSPQSNNINEKVNNDSVVPTGKRVTKSKELPPAILVNLTNAELERPCPATEDPVKWARQKPFWNLVASWEVWNCTEGAKYRDVPNYLANAPQKHKTALFKRVQDIGRWLDAWNDPVGTIHFDLLYTYTNRLINTLFKERPVEERKFPTSKEAFDRQLGNFLTVYAMENNHE